jgi:hypothetical protein
VLVFLFEERRSPGEQRLGWEAYAQWCPPSDPATAAHSAGRPAPAPWVGVQVLAVEGVLAGLAYEPEVLLGLSPQSPHLAVPHLAVPHLAVPHLAVPHLAVPHLAVPHLALPHLAVPHLAVPAPGVR